MKHFKRMKKALQSFLVFTMAFLVATSSLATAFATYGILVPYDPGSQTVTVEHIWVDGDNKDNTRPDEVKENVSAEVHNDDGTTTPENFTPAENAENKDKDDVEFSSSDTMKDNGATAGENAGKHNAENDLKNLEDGQDTLTPENPGNDSGFVKGYEDGYNGVIDAANKDKEDDDKINVEWPKPAEGENPDGQEPAEGETPDGQEPAEGETPDGQEPAEGETPDGQEPAEGETPDGQKPAEGETPEGQKPAEGETPEGQKPDEAEKPAPAELPENVQNAIKDVLGAAPTDDVVKDSLNPSDVDAITGELLDNNAKYESNAGNVWEESKDYVAEVQVKDGKDAPPVTYKVELDSGTKQALEKSNYDSVQLKVTVETVFAVKDDRNEYYIDPYYGTVVWDPILAVCQHVSYDNGKTWQIVGEPEFHFSENGKPAGVYRYPVKDDDGEVVKDENGNAVTKELGWQQYKDELIYWDDPEHGYGGLKSDADKAESVEYITEYDASRDYVSETTYTFLHVLNTPEPEGGDDPKPTKEKDPKPEGGNDPETHEEEIPEEEIPEEEVPLADQEIPEDDIPLADVPQTGDFSSMWTILAMASVTGLLGAALLERKKEVNS